MSSSGSTGGSEGNNLMRGRLVSPSGMVPPPFQDDVISSPNVSVASGNVSSVGGVGALGPPNPSLGQFSDPSRQDFDQSRARGAPGFGLLHDAFSRDVRNVAPSPSPSFNPTSLLFPLSDSGFASLPSSVPFSSSPAFSLPLSSFSASTFSSLASSAPLPLFTLPSVVPSVLSLSSSSSVPSFPLQQFPHPVYASATLPSSPAPLPSFSAPPFSLAPVHPPPGFSAPPSFPQAPLSSVPFASAHSVSAVSSAPSLSSGGGGGALPRFPPVSTLSSSSLSSSSSSSTVGDLADFQVRVLGLSAEYQALGRWFMASGGSDFRSYLASHCPHLYSDFRADFASGSHFLAALSSSASLPLPPSSVSSLSLPSQPPVAPVPVSSSLAPSAPPHRFPAPLLPPPLLFSSFCSSSGLPDSSGVFFYFAFSS